MWLWQPLFEPAWWYSYFAAIVISFLFLYRSVEVMPEFLDLMASTLPPRHFADARMIYLVATSIVTQIFIVLAYRYPVELVSLSIVLCRRVLFHL